MTSLEILEVRTEKITKGFADAVHRCNFEKISYNIWKKIVESDRLLYLVRYKDILNDIILLYQYNGSELIEVDVNSPKENTFGDFLRSHWNIYAADCCCSYVTFEELNILLRLTPRIYGSALELFIKNYLYGVATANTAVLLTTSDYSNTIQNTATGAQSSSKIYNSVNNTITSVDYKKGEKENMSNIVKFDFGPVSGNQFRMSPYGVAVKTQSNGWVAYNSATNDVMDVDILNFDISRYMYKIPATLEQVVVGDIVLHGGKPMFVKNKNSDGTIKVINFADSTVVDIMPVKSPFGFNFFTRITSLIDFSKVQANADNPFGSILPFMMLSESEDKTSDLLPFMLMMNGGNFNGMNPMMLYFLLNKESNSSDMLPFLLMGNGALFPNTSVTNSPEKTV